MRDKIVSKCACGAAYTAEQFAALPQPPNGGEMSDGDGGTLTLRNCWDPCGSTLAVESRVLGRLYRELVIQCWVDAADVYERLGVTDNVRAAVSQAYRGCAWDLANVEAMS